MDLVIRFASLFLCWTFFVNPGVAETPTPYPAFLLDHNQDGAIDSKDLLILLRMWGLQGIVTPTPSSTFSPSRTTTQTPSPSQTATFTASFSPPSATPTLTPTLTHTPTSTETLSFTPTETFTDTPTPSPTEAPTLPLIIDVVPPAVTLRFVHIPAGSFMMGSPDTETGRDSDEGPVHEVTIDYDFYIGETEITEAQWTAVMGANSLSYTGVGPDYPVRLVTWSDCQDFIAVLNASGQGTFRLPSEAEWEYACRAGTSTRFYFGDSAGCPDGCENCLAQKTVILLPLRSNYIWYCGNSLDSFQKVRQLYSNGFFLYDMLGNLGEWCEDHYHPDYTGAPTDGSPWLDAVDTDHVVRGGAYNSPVEGCRSASRVKGLDEFDTLYFGFRVVRVP